MKEKKEKIETNKQLVVLDKLGAQQRNLFHMRCIKLSSLYSNFINLNATGRLTTDPFRLLFNTYQETCMQKNCYQDIFELCLQAFGILWLKKTELLLDSSEIIERMEEKFKAKTFNEKVKANMLDTFCKFMAKFDDKSTEEEENIVKKLAVLEKKLESLAVEGLNSPFSKVREAATKLIINLFE